MHKPQFSLLVLRSRDVEATVSFYRAFGLTFEQEQHGSGPVHYSCAWEKFVLEIYPRKPGQGEEDTAMLGFQVAGLEAVLEKLGTQADIKIGEWGRFCNVKDPDGRVVRLSEENNL